ERDDAPERRRGRHALQRERGRAEAEDRDHEDRRHAAEEVGIHDRERPQREEHRPGQAADHREQQSEREDEDLRDAEDLHVELERTRDLGERGAELAPVEERAPHLGPARSVRDGDGEQHEEDHRARERDRDAARPARTEPEDLRAAVYYFRTGAPVAFASHCCRIPASWPFAFRVASARLTQATSGLSLAKTMPKCSPPAMAGNWPST